MGCRILVPLILMIVLSSASAARDLAGCTFENVTIDSREPFKGGIRLDVSRKLKPRFDEWQRQLLSTEFGRAQWEQFASNEAFRLTIVVTTERGMNAGTDRFEWDEAGDFVGATITLGDKIEHGHPDSFYYPILESLSTLKDVDVDSPRLLAVAKLSHEIGHVQQALETNAGLLRTQDKLIPAYRSIFLKNGHNASDAKLLEMARQMGGTPTEIWEFREYSSEAIALRFLSERLASHAYYCSVLRRAKKNIDDYAGPYRSIFSGLPELNDGRCRL